MCVWGFFVCLLLTVNCGKVSWKATTQWESPVENIKRIRLEADLHEEQN